MMSIQMNSASNNSNSNSNATNSPVLGRSLMIAGMVSSVVGNYFSAKVQKINAASQARMAKINAENEEKKAQSALMVGEYSAAMGAFKAGRSLSAQRANMAANGVDLSEGNPAELIASGMITKTMDMNTTLANAVRAAWGMRAGSVSFENESYSQSAAGSAISPWFSSMSSLIDKAGAVAKNWS